VRGDPRGHGPDRADHRLQRAGPRDRQGGAGGGAPAARVGGGVQLHRALGAPGGARHPGRHRPRARFFLDGSPGEQAFLVTQIEASLEGGDSLRFDASQALLKKDAEAFEEALEALIDEHRDFHDTGLQEARIPEERWAVEGCLFIEGLALVRLAQAAGIPVAGGYPLIPSLVMPLYKLPYDPEAWRVP
jgi:hypothetical protein